jgi:hypothetical protein
MKVISLLQPWATLVVIGAKKIETRSWNTKYRGDILIHASRRKIKINELDVEVFNHLSRFIPQREYPKLPYGAIIGKAKITDTCETELLNAFDYAWGDYVITPEEKAFGDYSPNRFCWLLKDALQFKYPVPAKGSLSLWEHPDIHEEEIICPECGLQQWATVEHTIPFGTFVHACSKCKYIIMESEWNTV